MNLLSTLVRLGQYNQWANDELATFIMESPEELFDQELLSSFTSIRLTVNHLNDAQELWLGRLNGNSAQGWPVHDAGETRSASLERLQKSSAGLSAFCENLNDNQTESSFDYKTLDGKLYTGTISEILLHVFHHGSYHRGQVISMLRQSGRGKTGSTDLIRFQRLYPSGV